MTQPRQQRSAGEGIDGVPKSSAWASVFTMINTAVGAGVLSFPFAFLLTGWLAGLLVTAGVAAAEAWTLYVLSRFAADTGAHSYSELVGGPSAGSISLALHCLACALAGAAAERRAVHTCPLPGAQNEPGQ